MESLERRSHRNFRIFLMTEKDPDPVKFNEGLEHDYPKMMFSITIRGKVTFYVKEPFNLQLIIRLLRRKGFKNPNVTRFYPIFDQSRFDVRTSSHNSLI